MSYADPDRTQNTGNASLKAPIHRAARDAFGVESSRPKACSEAEGVALGKDAKYVGRSARRSGRKVLYQLQRRAAWLLPLERVSKCRWAIQRRDQAIEVTKHSDGRASYAGLQTCASVWACPVCSQRVSEQRRQEMNHCLAWARAEEHRIYMLTLTCRHERGDSLEEQLSSMKAALKRLRQRRDWKAIKRDFLIGNVTATEVTHGANGWHTHFHIILIANSSIDDRLEGLRNSWLSSLRTEGLDGVGEFAFRVDHGDRAGEYVAKFGAAEEITLGQQKRGRGEGRTPFQLLHDFTFEHERRAGGLFVEFAETFKGTRQLVWSNGLRELCGADDIDDDEAAGDGEGDEMIALIDNETWVGDRAAGRLGARYRRVKILDAAEFDATACRVIIASNEEDDEPEAFNVIDDDPDPPGGGWSP